ncbi:DUF5059 domain-containing protein [Natronomonas sp. LN261]|uniref:DUF5059 domain-containing protein n=1 Tax=Natronomonas sp. LN261 TaxID=2750669 RepID=UPI0015EF84A6|nr:DUF5059 domain-containing protein [Natronomonas sp. LN261]
MQQTRRTWIRAGLTAVASVAVAGCETRDNDGDEGTTSGAERDSASDDSETERESEADAADIAVVSEWNAIRTRLRDPVVLGRAEAYAAGASVVGDIFRRFETASGDHNAHETLEETSEESYEGFEDALGDLRERLDAEDLEGAHDAMRTADERLREAQAALTSESVAERLSVLVVGARVEDAAVLLELEDYDGAEDEFSDIGTEFEADGHYEVLAGVDTGAADRFVDALDRAAETAVSAPTEATRAAHEAFDAATRGIYALAGDPVAGAGHMAALQARGWDGTVLGRLGGPSESYAHAAALNDYRAHARDAEWLYENGSEEAAAFVQRALERFETARAHDALEEAEHDTYEAFEDGLEALGEAIESGDDDGVSEAAEAVEGGVRDGIAALATGDGPAVLEAGYTKARIEDAYERYRLGHGQRAAGIARDVFADFEADAGGFHEALEETDEELYEVFEHEHLEALIEAFQNGDDEAATAHVEGIRETLLSFETAVGPRAVVGGVEAGYLTARLRDAVVLDRLGSTERGRTVTTEAFQHFETGAGGFHEAIEEADHGTYESFEESMTTLRDSLGSDGATEAMRTATDRATDATYTVVTAGGGGSGAKSVVSEVFAHFENAAVHDTLEEADSGAYESFEDALERYVDTLESGGDAQTAAGRFADASLQAQFAVAGAPGEAPVEADREGEHDDASDGLEGGPDVVDGVPEDADHVVEMQAVAFDPAELTVSVGETVAWRWAAGEPHDVVAYEDGIPEDATYWASGGFESEEAARTGWENGEGAVQSGQSYVHTFETPGTHEYLCVPHEAAGMVGTVIVEES